MAAQTVPGVVAAAAPSSGQALGLRTARPRFGAADAALAGFVIAIVGLMVVPLPTWLLDLLLASNLAGSVAILQGRAGTIVTPAGEYGGPRDLKPATPGAQVLGP